MIRTLSKTALISAWQCPKKLYLEKRHPELGEVSESTELLFAMGHQVGAIAQDILRHTGVGRDSVQQEDGPDGSRDACTARRGCRLPDF